MIETVERISLKQLIAEKVNRYLNEKKGQEITNLYELVIEQVEESLFSTVIKKSQYNQSKAAAMLGINRGTFRVRLKHYFNDKYFGSSRRKVI